MATECFKVQVVGMDGLFEKKGNVNLQSSIGELMARLRLDSQVVGLSRSAGAEVIPASTKLTDLPWLREGSRIYVSAVNKAARAACSRANSGSTKSNSNGGAGSKSGRPNGRSIGYPAHSVMHVGHT